MSVIEQWLAAYPLTTRGLYSRVLAGFVAATNVPVTDATQDDVAKYHAAIGELAPSTVATKLAILSSFYAYLVKRGIRPDNPMVAIAHRPKVDKKASVKWLDNDEQRALIAAAESTRDRAILWVLLHGLRLAELVGLDIEDYQRGELRFTGKGDQSRTVPLIMPAQNALAAYLGRRRHGPMFRGPHGRISRRQVQRIVHNLTLRATGKRLSPHPLRHSFATRHVKAGTGMPQLQGLMGHRALSSTQLYVHLDTDDLRQAMNNDPLAEPQELQVIEGGKEAVG